MIVLGINAFHSDASATILVDGQVRFAVAEERLNRIKHFGGFPTLSIVECLKAVGADIADVDHIAIGRDPDVHLSRRLRYGARNPLRIPNLARLRRRGQGLKQLRQLVASELESDPARLRFEEHFVEHHLAHTASAYLCAGLERAAGLSVDGSGDFVTTMLTSCEGTSINVLKRVFVPHSLGAFYSMVCDFIGYQKYGDEGKVMGLAALGGPELVDKVRELVVPHGDLFRLRLENFVPMGSNMGIEITPSGEVISPRMFSDRMIEMFGPPREPGQEITERDMNLAFAIQQRYEEILFHLVNGLLHRTGQVPLVMAGGCALNSVGNGKLFDRTSVKRTWIQPAAGDEGLSLGAALYCWHSRLGKPLDYEMTDAYLGPSFTGEFIEHSLDKANLEYERLDRSDLLGTTARAISEGKIIGWFQGRMEWGPRALGNRSILAHPGLDDMKDVLNARIKHREWFRPFAPSILEEYLSEYFEHDHPSPFMLHVYKIRASKRPHLPGVTHVDGTGRLQTVSRRENVLYYDLIDSFRQITGLPILLNTSFNENEPIVCTPDEAIDCYVRTKMDVLVVGNYVAQKLNRRT